MAFKASKNILLILSLPIICALILGVGPLHAQGVLWIPVNANGEPDPPAGMELEPASRIGSLTGSFLRPFGVALDEAGNVYVADTANHRVHRIDPAGGVTTIAGAGVSGFDGDGGPAGSAWLASPSAVAVDGSGNVYVADWRNHRVRRIDLAGGITTIAGSSKIGYAGDDGPATEARLFEPIGVAVDGSGSVYVADRRNHRIRRIDAAGIITTYAGTGEEGSDGDGGPATEARLSYPAAVAVDGAGSVYVADMGNSRVRRIDATGIITAYAGTGEQGSDGDGGPASEARLSYPAGMAVDSSGNVYVADMLTGQVRRIDSAGTITTFAGALDGGSRRDGGPATEAELAYPSGVALDAAGNIYIAEYGNSRVRVLRPGQYLSVQLGTSGDRHLLTVAEDGTLTSDGFPVRNGSSVVASNGDRYVLSQGETGPVAATLAPMLEIPLKADGTPDFPQGSTVERVNVIESIPIAGITSVSGVAVDKAGNVFVAQSQIHRIRMIDATGLATTVAGTGMRGSDGDGGAATEAQLSQPAGVAVDKAGNVYFADSWNNRVRKIDATGIITTYAGTGERGFDGDGGPATEAQLWAPTGVAVDGSGNLYVADTGNHRIRRIDATGAISTYAGTGEQGFDADGGPATEAQLWAPTGVAVDGSGNLYVADTGNHRVRKIDATGTITTHAGVGFRGYGGDGGPATEARLTGPSGVAVDGSGNLYVADTGNSRVRKIDAAGMIATYAGTSEFGDSGNRGPATEAQLGHIAGIAVDGAGNVYLTQQWSGVGAVRVVKESGYQLVVSLGSSDQTVALFRSEDGILRLERESVWRGRQVSAPNGNTYALTRDSSGAISADFVPEVQILELAAGEFVRLTRDEAGTWRIGSDVVESSHRHTQGGRDYVLAFSNGKWGLAGYTVGTVAGSGNALEGVSATDAVLGGPCGIAIDAAGNSYLADEVDHRVRKVDVAGIINTLAGTGNAGSRSGGASATEMELNSPCGVTVDTSGNVYVADRGNHRVRKIDLAGGITTVAGTGELGFSGNGGQAAGAQLAYPTGVAVDTSGNVYVADRGNHRVRKVDAAGGITTVAGTGELGFSGDGGQAAGAQLAYPAGVAVDASGNVYVADRGNHRVRKVDAAGGITTVAGTGELGFSGDGGQAAGAQLAYPTGVAVDASGNVYVADRGNHRVRKVDAAGGITTVAGTGELGFSGDGGQAAGAQLAYPTGVAVDASGNVYVADRGNHRVRKIDAAGGITTVAGMGQLGDGGDSGEDMQAPLNEISSVAVDGTGNVYVAARNQVRRVDWTGSISTFAGTGVQGFSGDGGPAMAAQFHDVAGMAVDGVGNVFVADRENRRIRRIDAEGTVTTYAGTGEFGSSGDGGPAARARFCGPTGLAMDAFGNLYVADATCHKVRRIDAIGVIRTMAGTGEPGYGGDGGPASEAFLDTPYGVAVDADGKVYVADLQNHRVRRIDATGTITTIAGTGLPGYRGDNGPATKARLWYPLGVGSDGAGNVYIADSGNHRVRRIDAAGVIATIAGSGEIGVDADGVAARSSRLSVSGIAVDQSGNIWLADRLNRRLRVLEPATSTGGRGLVGLSPPRR